MEWISVEYRLPEEVEEEELLITVHFGDENIGEGPGEVYLGFYSGMFSLIDSRGVKNIVDAIGGTVTHWMPLPKPPTVLRRG